MDEIDRLVGRNVRRLRRQGQVSPSRFASAIGVTPERLAAFETGRARISAATLYAITVALSQPAEKFFTLMH